MVTGVFPSAPQYRLHCYHSEVSAFAPLIDYHRALPLLVNFHRFVLTHAVALQYRLSPACRYNAVIMTFPYNNGLFWTAQVHGQAQPNKESYAMLAIAALIERGKILRHGLCRTVRGVCVVITGAGTGSGNRNRSKMARGGVTSRKTRDCSYKRSISGIKMGSARASGLVLVDICTLISTLC